MGLRCDVRVLVVEDDPSLADVLILKLKREGHTVTLAPTQSEAYHALDDGVFDFALLDLRLPTHAGDMDPNSEVGFSVLAHIRDRFDPTRLPVIVMTAYEGTSQTAVRALKAGANDYITKPFADSPVSLDEKLATVVNCIESARAATGTVAVLEKPHWIRFQRPDGIHVDGMPLTGRQADLLWLLGSPLLTLPTTRGGSPTEVKTQLTGQELARQLGVTDQTVRQYVRRFREWVAEGYRAQGKTPPGDDEVVMNTPWKGYQINLQTCRVSAE